MCSNVCFTKLTLASGKEWTGVGTVGQGTVAAAAVAAVALCPCAACVPANSTHTFIQCLTVNNCGQTLGHSLGHISQTLSFLPLTVARAILLHTLPGHKAVFCHPGSSAADSSKFFQTCLQLTSSSKPFLIPTAPRPWCGERDLDWRCLSPSPSHRHFLEKRLRLSESQFAHLCAGCDWYLFHTLLVWITWERL